VKGNSPVPKKRTSVIIKTFGSNEKEKSVNDKNRTCSGHYAVNYLHHLAIVVPESEKKYFKMN
jgi:hypothetical protein